jgi:hypothetical protein
MATAVHGSRGRFALGAVLLVGAAVSVSLGVYGSVHQPALRPLWLLGFSGMLQAKAWLATAAIALAVVQFVTGLWMFGRLPGAGPAPPVAATVHRWSGALAFVLLVPVALHCLWSLGFTTSSPRVLVHSVAGCAFYGAYVAKMLGLRVRGLPGWALPVLGGLVFTAVVLAWLTGALWFFTRSGLAVT